MNDEEIQYEYELLLQFAAKLLSAVKEGDTTRAIVAFNVLPEDTRDAIIRTYNELNQQLPLL